MTDKITYNENMTAAWRGYIKVELVDLNESLLGGEVGDTPDEPGDLAVWRFDLFGCFWPAAEGHWITMLDGSYATQVTTGREEDFSTPAETEKRKKMLTVLLENLEENVTDSIQDFCAREGFNLDYLPKDQWADLPEEIDLMNRGRAEELSWLSDSDLEKVVT